MGILGAHQSIAGGLHRAVERAHACGCQCLQIFTKNTNQWRAKDIAPEEASLFRDAVERLGVLCPVAHDSYLVNLASPDPDLWQKSIDAMVLEFLRADALGIPWVVAHPGAYTTSSEAEGLRRIVAGLSEVLSRTRGQMTGCLLETTAGQGTSLGWRFEHLAEILDRVNEPQRLGICFDTCHVFAAGYPLATPAEYRKTMKIFDQVVGLSKIHAFHLNDSVRECGSRIDRHAHIGEGKIGLGLFRCLVRDRRFRNTPMVLETPKGTENGQDRDAVNLQKLRSLAGQ